MATNYSNEKIIKCKKSVIFKMYKCKMGKRKMHRERLLEASTTRGKQLFKCEAGRNENPVANLHSFFFSSWIEYHPKICHLAFDNSYALLCY